MMLTDPSLHLPSQLAANERARRKYVVTIDEVIKGVSIVDAAK